MDRHTPDPFKPAVDPDDRHAAKRETARDSLFLSATLRINDREQTVRVRNLSAGGLMAEYAGMAVLQQPVTIDLRGIGEVKGRIAWATDGRIGIAFLEPIDPQAARRPVAAKAKDSDWLHVYPAATPPRMKR